MWLQHKEKMSQLIANETARRARNMRSTCERFEARLRVLEQIVTDGGVQTARRSRRFAAATRRQIAAVTDTAA